MTRMAGINRPLQHQLFKSNEELIKQQEKLTDRAATRVAEIASRLKD